MKKIIVSLLVLVLALGMFAACGTKKDEGTKTNLTGTTAEIADKLNEDAKVELMVGNNALDSENAEYFAGLTAEQFTQYIEEGTASEAMIGSQAHSMVILKVKDAKDAATVKKLVFDNVNTGKWVCVQAEQVYAAESGNYVFFVMSFKEVADSLNSSFKTLAGTYGEVLSKANSNM